MSQAAAKPLSTSDLIFGIVDACTKVATRPKVYPAYIASRIKSALLLDDPKAPRPDDHVIEAVGSIETIGDCRYAIEATDHNGTKYRITVEVVR